MQLSLLAAATSGSSLWASPSPAPTCLLINVLWLHWSVRWPSWAVVTPGAPHTSACVTSEFTLVSRRVFRHMIHVLKRKTKPAAWCGEQGEACVSSQAGGQLLCEQVSDLKFTGTSSPRSCRGPAGRSLVRRPRAARPPGRLLCSGFVLSHSCRKRESLRLLLKKAL